jgi:hypothetical protein
MKQITIIAAVGITVVGWSASAYQIRDVSDGVDEDCYVWTSWVTQDRVKSRPAGLRYLDYNANPHADSYPNPFTGGQFVRQNDGRWIDSKSGKTVPTVPINCLGNEWSSIPPFHKGDKQHLTLCGHSTFVRVPCPTPAPVAPAPPEKPKEHPNPLEKILQHVSVGVGVNGGTTVGHDEHKGDHHVTDHKRTSSTTKKTLPAGCKCHPCTCSPCHCGG